MRLAIIAFLFHVPGLRLLANHSVDRKTLRLNAIALILTLAMAGVLAVTASSAPERWLRGIAAVALGHVLWGGYLACVVRRKN